MIRRFLSDRIGPRGARFVSGRAGGASSAVRGFRYSVKCGLQVTVVAPELFEDLRVRTSIPRATTDTEKTKITHRIQTHGGSSPGKELCQCEMSAIKAATSTVARLITENSHRFL